MMFHDVSCFTPTCFMEEISRIDTQLVKKYCRITNPHIHKMAATFLSGYQAKTWRITNRQTFSYSVWYAELRIGIFLKYCRILQNSNSSYNWNLNWNGNWASQVAWNRRCELSLTPGYMFLHGWIYLPMLHCVCCFVWKINLLSILSYSCLSSVKCQNCDILFTRCQLTFQNKEYTKQ